MPTLDALLAAAAVAGPLDRIELRDAIAAHGDLALEAMTDWLSEPRLAAFAVRVLERIGRDPEHRGAVLATLASVEHEGRTESELRDLDSAMASLGVAPRGRGRGAPIPPARGPRSRPVGSGGTPGRGAWVMRTSQARRDIIWSEAQAGRLRQGWGWTDRQDLGVIADMVRRGEVPDEEQQLAWRARRMLTTQPDGVRAGDLVVAPNLPSWGEISVFRVTGGYAWAPMDLKIEDRFGHVLPVELLASAVDRRSPQVSDALRSSLRSQQRLYWIGAVLGDVEALLPA